MQAGSILAFLFRVLLLAGLAFIAIPIWRISESLRRLLAGLGDIEHTLGRLAKAVEFFERRP